MSCLCGNSNLEEQFSFVITPLIVMSQWKLPFSHLPSATEKNNFVFILLECSSKLRNLLALLVGINRAFFVPQGICSCLLNTDRKQMFCTCYRSACLYLLLQAVLLWMNFPGAKPSLSALCLHNKEDTFLGSLLKLLQVNDYCGLRLSETHRHLTSCAQQLCLQRVLKTWLWLTCGMVEGCFLSPWNHI